MKEKRSTKILIAVGVVVNLALIILIASFIFGNSSHRFKGTYSSPDFEIIGYSAEIEIEKNGEGTLTMDTWTSTFVVKFDYEFVGKKDGDVLYKITVTSRDISGMLSAFAEDNFYSTDDTDVMYLILGKDETLSLVGDDYENRIVFEKVN